MLSRAATAHSTLWFTQICNRAVEIPLLRSRQLIEDGGARVRGLGLGAACLCERVGAAHSKQVIS